MVDLDRVGLVTGAVSLFSVYELVSKRDQLFLFVCLIRDLNVVGVLIIDVLLVLTAWLDQHWHFVVDDVEEIDIRVNESLHYSKRSRRYDFKSCKWGVILKIL